ncbi:MAG: hypothetical protein V1832_02230 [Nitrospirota bacterium]
MFGFFVLKRKEVISGNLPVTESFHFMFCYNKNQPNNKIKGGKNKMDDLARYNEINKHITSIETYFDVLHVISNNGLLREIKSSSMGCIFAEMAEKLEAIKKLHEETYERLKGNGGPSRYVSPF